MRKIDFIMSKFMKNTSFGDSYCQVDVINDCVKQYSSDPHSLDGLEASLIGKENHENNEAKAYKKLLDENSTTQNQNFKLLMTYS